MKGKLEGKVKIKAIHDDDLQSFLEKTGLLKDLLNSHLQCSFCDCVLTLDNFGGAFNEHGEIIPFCQKTECYLEALNRKGAVNK